MPSTNDSMRATMLAIVSPSLLCVDWRPLLVPSAWAVVAPHMGQHPPSPPSQVRATPLLHISHCQPSPLFEPRCDLVTGGGRVGGHHSSTFSRWPLAWCRGWGSKTPCSTAGGSQIGVCQRDQRLLAAAGKHEGSIGV